jgi:transcriptional regulator with XRE-family HTH domain
VLKRERLARHLKQEVLAAQLHINERTLVSWETGARLPPVGMVLYLSRRLLGSKQLDNEFMRAYLLDDLAWQLSLRQDEAILCDLQEAFVALTSSNEAEAERKPVQQELSLDLFEKPTAARPGAADREKREAQVEDAPSAAGKGGGEEIALGLLTVLDTLRRDPALISVVLDFLKELGQ